MAVKVIVDWVRRNTSRFAIACENCGFAKGDFTGERMKLETIHCEVFQREVTSVLAACKIYFLF